MLGLRLSGTKTFVLMYGIRKVGKTIIGKFLETKTGFRIDYLSMVSGEDFFWYVFCDSRYRD
ncbi:MAG: hypothetical protein Q6363_000130 [Candidatus Njordarchaeota archaeon]